MRYALTALLFWLGILHNVALAQDSRFAGLKADRIVFISGAEILRATGNVEVVFDNVILSAAELVFDSRNGTIRAEGPLRLRDGDNLTIVAEYAELSSDLKTAMLRSARMVLNEQLQITAVEIARDNGKYSQLFRAAASSCTVSEAHPTPLWQVRAARVVHDEEAKQLYFENAQLRIGRLPVAYIPRMRVPDPTVRRANGFLVPEIGSSSTQGVFVAAPYFITLGDYADVTLTPYLYSAGTVTLLYDFRKRFHRGSLDIEGAVTRDSQTGFSTRAYLFANGDWKSKQGLRSGLSLELTSDATYLSNHNFSDKTRLENSLTLGKTTRRTDISVGISAFRTLSSTTPASDLPFLLADVSTRTRWSPSALGGHASLNLSAFSFTRASNVDATGRDGVRLTASADWTREWTANSGLIIAAISDVSVDYYNIRQDVAFATPLSRVTPTIAADFRMPLVRQRGKATQTLEPRLQLVWSKSTGAIVPNEDSVIVEFDAANLFALNHFTGVDAIETGLRANIGLSWSRRAATGWNVGATIGQVVRLSDLGQFTTASGLSGVASSFVFAGQAILPGKMRFSQRTVFDGNMNVTKNETAIGAKVGKFDIDTSYLWLTAGAAGNTADRSEWMVKTGIPLLGNWRATATGRYDFRTAAASDAGVALTYRNDCIKVDLSLSRQFTSSSNVSASTSLGLQVTLDGFGARANSDAYSRKCSDY